MVPETGTCACADADKFMHSKHGCLPCSYMLPGCRTCSQVSWSSGIPLDADRLLGPGKGVASLTCNQCDEDNRFVRIDLDTSIPAPAGFNYTTAVYSNLPAGLSTKSAVKCSSCLKKYDGCSSCGTYGESCTNCYPTHTLHTPTTQVNVT